MTWVTKRIASQYPTIAPELTALTTRFPDLAAMPLFLNTLWAILDAAPSAFARPLPPDDWDEARLMQTLTYLKNRKPTQEIVGWLAAYQQQMQEQAMRFAGNPVWSEMVRQSLRLLLRCSRRVAEHDRAESKRKRRPKLL